MHKKIPFCLIPLLLYCGLSNAKELKIGYVNSQRVIAESPQAKRVSKALEKEFLPRKKKIEADQKKLRKLEENHSRDSSVMSEAERGKLEKQIIAKRRNIKRSAEELKEDINLRQNEVFSKLQRQILETIQAFGKEEGFDLLLPRNVLIYAADSIDVTDQIQRKLK